MVVPIGLILVESQKVTLLHCLLVPELVDDFTEMAVLFW